MGREELSFGLCRKPRVIAPPPQGKWPKAKREQVRELQPKNFSSPVPQEKLLL